METVIERMERIGAKEKISAFIQKEHLPYEQKVIHAMVKGVAVLNT